MKFLVIGLGKTGISVLKYLISCGHTVLSFDTRVDPALKTLVSQQFPGTPCFLGTLPELAWEGVQVLVMSPGLDPNLPLVADILKIAQAKQCVLKSDIELFLDAVKLGTAKILGVTGSIGKSTVSALTFEMLKASGFRVKLGGNFGIPALDLLEEGLEYYVLELSSFQLDLLPDPPNLFAATVLNVSPNHLDRHKTMDHYRRVKAKIYEGVKFKIIHASEDLWTVWNSDQRLSSFSVRLHEGQFYLFHHSKALMPAASIRLLGHHNLENALAALALVSAVFQSKGVQDFSSVAEPSLKVLRSFEGLPHRCRYVATLEGVTWINDSKGTTGLASQAALEACGPHALAAGGKIILIAGGQAKGATFENLQMPVSRYAKALIVFGQDAPQLKKDLASWVMTYHVQDLKSAMALAKKLAVPNDWVLLSPACASLDMFRDYEQRGEMFEAEVRGMASLLCCRVG